MIVAADTVFVQLWFLLSIQNHDTIATVCNRLAIVLIQLELDSHSYSCFCELLTW